MNTKCCTEGNVVFEQYRSRVGHILSPKLCRIDDRCLQSSTIRSFLISLLDDQAGNSSSDLRLRLRPPQPRHLCPMNQRAYILWQPYGRRAPQSSLLCCYCSFCYCATAAVAGSSWFVAGCVVVWDENRPLSDKAGSTDGFITSQRNLRFQNETISYSALVVLRITYGFVLGELVDVRGYKPPNLPPLRNFRF